MSLHLNVDLNGLNYVLFSLSDYKAELNVICRFSSLHLKIIFNFKFHI